MNILMASSEALPFSKTGGLSDVVYSLSREFAKEDTILVVTPFYKNIKLDGVKPLKKMFEFNVGMNWRNIFTEIYYAKYEHIHYFLVKNEYYFSRDGIYGYFDDGERFAYFSRAVIEFIKHLPFKIDILHSHDWQVGMLPCLIKNLYRDDALFKDVKTVLTIHNPLFKGYFNSDSLYDLYGLDYRLYEEGKIRLNNQVSTLKAGIVYADKITTVSPTHHLDLLSSYSNMGLEYDLTLRNDDFSGILNGINNEFFNPKKDKYIFKNYSYKNFKNGKKANKENFCSTYNLDPNKAVFTLISRLSEQKGLPLLYGMSEYILSRGMNLFILGSGEYGAECFFNNIRNRYPSNCFVYIGYNEELAHKLYAVSDFLLMPSQFEPCGLSQMIAQNYGTLPIVRLTGGLKDSVNPYKKENSREINMNSDGLGFESYYLDDGLSVINDAIRLYYDDKKLLNKIQLNAMQKDYSWKNSAKEYKDLYLSLIK